MNKILYAKAQLDLVAFFYAIEIQAKKEGWDEDPSWVKRGKDGKFGGGSGDTTNAGDRLQEKLEKSISDMESTMKSFQKDFKKISRENEKKILDFIWSDGAKEARKDIAKTLDKYLPGAGKSFEKSVDFINKEIIDRTDPNWDKMIINSFTRDIGRLKRRALSESTPIDRIEDAADFVGFAFAGSFTVGAVSTMLKMMTIPVELTWKALEFETKAVGSFYVDALKSGDPSDYMKKRAGIGLALYGLLMYGALHYTLGDFIEYEVGASGETFSKDVAPEVKAGIESVQKEVEDKWRSQQIPADLEAPIAPVE